MQDQKHTRKRKLQVFGWILFGSIIGSSVALAVFSRKKVPSSPSPELDENPPLGV